MVFEIDASVWEAKVIRSVWGWCQLALFKGHIWVNFFFPELIASTRFVPELPMEQKDTFFPICIIHQILLMQSVSVSSFIFYLIMYFLVRRVILEVIFFLINLSSKWVYAELTVGGYFPLSGTTPPQVFMAWTSLLSLNALDTVLVVAADASLALASNIELQRRMPWNGFKWNMKELSLTSPKTLVLKAIFETCWVFFFPLKFWAAARFLFIRIYIFL